MLAKSHPIQKLLSLRCLVCSITLIFSSIFWASSCSSTAFSNPASYFPTPTTALQRYPQQITGTITCLVLLYWLTEFWIRFSKSKIRFFLTLATAVITPFLLTLIFMLVSDVFPQERDIKAIQKARFKESGKFLKNANKLTLYSLLPVYLTKKELLSKREEFHEYKVLGKLEINNKETIRAIHLNLQGQIYSRLGESYTSCFDPRHGIRAHRGNDFVDYLICFNCHHLYIYETEDGDYERIGLEGPQVNQLLNDLIDKAGIKRDKPPADKR